MKKFLSEFKEFALKGNMLDLAVGVLIGGAFSGLVGSLTTNIIQPILDCFGSKAADGATKLEIPLINGARMPIGVFIKDVINFIIMALVIFLIVKGINKLRSLGKKKEEAAAPTTKKCPFCASEIPIEAVRCPHCTSELPADKAPVAKEEAEAPKTQKNVKAKRR